MKKFLAIVVLCFFCSNVAFSKPEMYYCIKEKTTGFKNGEWKAVNFHGEKFKAKVDFDNLTVSSSIKDLFIDAKCHWGTIGYNMVCFDRMKNNSLKIQRVDENFNSFIFTYASLGLFSIKSRKDDLTISYGNCEKF